MDKRTEDRINISLTIPIDVDRDYCTGKGIMTCRMFRMDISGIPRCMAGFDPQPATNRIKRPKECLRCGS